jgi:hypothetical protein
MTVGEGTSTHSSPEEGILSGRQMALYRALGKKDPQLGAMYLGAISVLKNVANADRFAQAAHSLRELLEKLPRILDMPIQAKSPGMMDKIRPIEKLWIEMKVKSEGSKPNPGSAVIDKSLQNFLLKIDAFFIWLGSDRQTRKQQAANVVRRLDPLKKTLPKTIESLHVEEWERYRDHFVGVSHHQIVEEFEEFMKWVDGVESYLLDRLVPRTFDDFTRLDKIIGEGEANG